MGTPDVNPPALLDIAAEAATRAGKLLLTRFGGPASGVGTKTSATDLVSDADRDAERLILEFITSERPEDAILAEEGGGGGRGEGGGDLTWVVDPLDGTVNYLFGIPVWCVSIAVLEGGEPVAGVIHDPNGGETFSATSGGGSFLDGRPIVVSDQTDLERALVGTGFAYDPEVRARQAEVVAAVVPQVRDIRRTGSAALDLASVACSRLDAFYEANMEPWDKAAGVLLIREAGGELSRLPHPLLPAAPEGSSLVAVS